jgi:membrane protein DedA with SNARE-associated domain/rhodanese-related sulfurtransferase
MDALLHLIANYGLAVVFVSVLIDQGGIPIPAYPALIVTASLAVRNGEAAWPIVLVAVVASLIADLAWFAGGRRYGVRLLRLMCRVSLSPESCVLATRGIYARWGAPSLMVAKFMPGFAAVATVLAGETRVRVSTFLLFDAIGALVWAALAVLLGVVFHNAVNEALDLVDTFGRYGLLLLALLVLAFVAWKWWQRKAYLDELRMARVTPAELLERMQAGESTLILDVRGHKHRSNTGWIPGSVHIVTLDDAANLASDEVIVYCDCPNELSAAALAVELRKRGFSRVRPLAGGFESWRELGHPVESARR